jgi:AAA15 family ATPase/GTPase
MRLRNLSIHNYKSLRHVSFAPTNMPVLVGPNASGKTNIADAIDFLSEVYTHGLEIAVAGKGGYENTAFRKQASKNRCE